MTDTDPATQVEFSKDHKTATITVREFITKLAFMEDMDAEVCFTFHNSDPIPITDISDSGDGQVVVSA